MEQGHRQSKYSIFMKRKMEELRAKEEYKDLNYREIFKMAAGIWKYSPENPANNK